MSHIFGVSVLFFFFFSSRRRHTRCSRDWSSDVCSSDLWGVPAGIAWDGPQPHAQTVEVQGVVLHGVWDLFPALERLLPEDLLGLLGTSDAIPRGAIVMGDPAWLAVHGAAVEPGGGFDTTPRPLVLVGG